MTSNLKGLSKLVFLCKGVVRVVEFVSFIKKNREKIAVGSDKCKNPLEWGVNVNCYIFEVINSLKFIILTRLLLENIEDCFRCCGIL